jgi:hypothetical protein
MARRRCRDLLAEYRVREVRFTFARLDLLRLTFALDVFCADVLVALARERDAV